MLATSPLSGTPLSQLEALLQSPLSGLIQLLVVFAVGGFGGELIVPASTTKVMLFVLISGFKIKPLPKSNPVKLGVKVFVKLENVINSKLSPKVGVKLFKKLTFIVPANSAFPVTCRISKSFKLLISRLITPLSV